MTEKVAILVEEQYQVLEVWYPYYRLQEEGWQVELLGTTKEVYGSKEGYPAPVHHLIKDVAPQDYKGVIIPGGFAPDFLRRYEEPIQFVRELWDLGKVVAAICHGVWIPASAGILKGRRATCFYAIRHDIIHAGAQYVDEEVCVDGHLITSRKPDDLPAFCKAILKALQSKGE